MKPLAASTGRGIIRSFERISYTETLAERRSLKRRSSNPASLVSFISGTNSGLLDTSGRE